jgi:hypothetical protein
MSTIIAGHFQLQSAAEEAVAALGAAGFDRKDLASFYVSPAGQHDLTPVGGDEDASVGMEAASSGAVSGAAIGGAIGTAMGLAAMEEFGASAAFVAGGVGAYVGSLLGAVGNMHDKPGTRADAARTTNLRRQSGMQVAALAPGEAEQASAVSILRSHGATDIEKPEGSIVAGDWLDFDPLSPLRRIPA